MIPFTDILFRTVPELARAGLASGDLALFGSVIRSTKTGQIAYHLQETGVFSRIAAAALMPGGFEVEAAKLASQVLGDAALYRQGQQIKAAVDLFAHQQIANLVLSGATLGVSVVGFAILASRIKRIEVQVTQLDRNLIGLKQSVDALRQDRIAEDLSLLRTMAQQMEESWELRDPTPQQERVAIECHVLANRFFDRSVAVLDAGKTGLLLAAPLIDAFGIAQSTRLAARIACDELDVAAGASGEALDQYETILDSVDASGQSLSCLREASADDLVSWPTSLQEAFDRPRLIAQSIRDRAEAIDSTEGLIATLRGSGMTGRDLVQAARNESEVPLLVLSAAGSGS